MTIAVAWNVKNQTKKTTTTNVSDHQFDIGFKGQDGCGINVCLRYCYSRFSFRPRREKTCLRGFMNNTGADQTAHPRSLISAFVIRVLESTICKRATSENLSF